MKIGNLFNMPSVRGFTDSIDASGMRAALNRVYGGDRFNAVFKDASAGTVLGQNLTYINPKVFTKKYPKLALLTAGIQADNSGGYNEIIKSLRIVEQGGFKTAGNSSDNGGKISLATEQSWINVIERKANSDWTRTKIEQAANQNINLISSFMEAHANAYAREVDKIGLIGMPSDGIATGLLNHAGFTASAAGGAIDTLTTQQMYSAIADLLRSQHNGVNNTPEYMADRVIMPVNVFNRIQYEILNTANGSSTVLKALQDNFPEVQFLQSYQANNTGAGVSATVAFSSSEDVLKMRIPVPLTIGEIVATGSFDFNVDSMYRIGGIDILENTGGRILTGL